MLPTQWLAVDVSCGQVTDEIDTRRCPALYEKGVAIVEDFADGGSAHRPIAAAYPHQPDDPIPETLLIVPRHIEYFCQDRDRKVLGKIFHYVAFTTLGE